MKFGYDPYRRHEVWRFFTPMFVHSGWSHLWGNLVMQLILGVFLEIVHEWKRIAVIYLASGFGGTLCITALDNTSYSVGASGAVMGLLFSHLSTIILNWNEMEKKIARFFCVALYIVYDVGTDVYNELYLKQRLNVSLMRRNFKKFSSFLCPDSLNRSVMRLILEELSLDFWFQFWC